MSFETVKRVINESSMFAVIRTMDMNFEQGSKLHELHLKQAKADLKKNSVQFGGAPAAWGIKVHAEDLDKTLKILKRNKLSTKVAK